MLLGYLPSDEPSDVFNKPLEQAVKLFQRANHLAQSGEADETLLRLLYSDAPAEYVIEYGNVGNDVRMLQERLMQSDTTPKNQRLFREPATADCC